MNDDQELSVKIEKLWDYFHSYTSELHEKEYNNLEIAGLMMAYSLKLYRMELDDNSYQGMLNYIFQQHNAMMNRKEKMPTLH